MRAQPKTGQLFKISLEDGDVVWGAVGVADAFGPPTQDPRSVILYFFRGEPPKRAASPDLLMDLQLTTRAVFAQGILVLQQGMVEPLPLHPLWFHAGGWQDERGRAIDPPQGPPWGYGAWVTPRGLVERVNVALGRKMWDGAIPSPEEIGVRAMRLRPEIYYAKG